MPNVVRYSTDKTSEHFHMIKHGFDKLGGVFKHHEDTLGDDVCEHNLIATERIVRALFDL